MGRVVLAVGNFPGVKVRRLPDGCTELELTGETGSLRFSPGGDPLAGLREKPEPEPEPEKPKPASNPIKSAIFGRAKGGKEVDGQAERG